MRRLAIATALMAGVTTGAHATLRGIATPIAQDFYGWQFGIVADDASKASSNCTNLSAALASINTVRAGAGARFNLPAGNIYTSCTFDNLYSNILVVGQGRDSGFYTAPIATSKTVIVPTFAGTAVKLRSPYGGSNRQNIGGGFQDITVIGNGIATRLFELDSVTRVVVRMTLKESVGADAANLHTCRSNIDLNDICDTQGSNIDLEVVQTANAAIGIVIAPGTNANLNANDLRLQVRHKNALGIDYQGGDNNIVWASTYRDAGGTADGQLIHGFNGTGSGWYGNIFTRLGTTGVDGTAPTVFAQGTDTGGITNGVKNTVINIDVPNNSSEPTSGTGSSWTYSMIGATAGRNGFYQNWGGTNKASQYAPSINSNFGAEGIEEYPGQAAGINRILHYNRAASTYVQELIIGSSFKRQLSGVDAELLDAKSHLRVYGTAPTISNCGTSPTLTAGSTDRSGEVTAGTGSPSPCSIVFAQAYTNSPLCTVTSQTNGVGLTYGLATTFLNIVMATPTAGAKFNWHCTSRD